MSDDTVPSAVGALPTGAALSHDSELRASAAEGEMGDQESVEAQRAHDRRWWTLGTLCLCLIVIGVDNTILNVALPRIVKDLNATGSQLQLMVDGYTIVFACLLLTAGSLGDRYGRRRALMFGLAWFAIFSALASTAASPVQLILTRGCMGVGGAFIFPTTLSVLTNTFHDADERARAIGIWAGVSGIGIALGPLAGGLLVENLGWGSIFLVNVPICTAALVMTRSFVPNSSARSEAPLDPVGAVFSVIGLIATLYGVIEGPDKGWLTPVVIASLVMGVGFLALFGWWESRSPAPMLDVRFFKNPRFSAASATITLTFFALYASTFLLTQYFQFILRYSPLKSGVMLIPTAAGIMTGSPMAPRFVQRFGTKRVVCAGLVLLGVAMGCYGSNTLMSSLPIGLLVRLVAGLGIGLTSAPVTESIMGSLPPSRAGVGSAVNDTTRQTGGAVGVAVIGSIFAARYHTAVGQLLFVPADQRSAAHESIGTSLQAAARISTTDKVTAARLVDTANHAYLASMRLTYTISVIIVAAAIGVAYRFLPARATPRVPMPYTRPSSASDVTSGRAPTARPMARGLVVGAENVAD